MKAKRLLAMAAGMCLGANAAQADVVTDWNDKAVAFVVGREMGPPPAERIMAMTHLAMFDAVNSIEGRYRPYLVQLEAPATASKEAAVAAAAGTVLAGVDPRGPAEMHAALETYLAAIPDSADKAEGVKLGEAVAAKFLEARANDGAKASDIYRPRTTPGVYVPTAPLAAPHWRGVKPFALSSPSQVRPEPPVALDSEEWAADYNEIRDVGGRDSTTRTARQTEDARFWLATDGRIHYPLVSAIVTGNKLDLIDSARLFALAAAARADALIAVFDAKYQYEFWRPVTAIRNGDVDGNPATDRDAAWQSVAPAPMHPEYPCAHCVSSASLAGVMLAVLGTADIPEASIESPTLPGVVHRWTNVRAYTDEVSEARIVAGFHYRFSSKVGQDMGYKIGEYVVKTILQPVIVKAEMR